MSDEKFSTLHLAPLEDGKRWILLSDYSYRSITVPCGFVTDFASVPNAFAGIVRRWGKHGPGAVVHNYLYWEQPYSRKMCDLIFLSIMLRCNVKRGRAFMIYYSVRLFGWYYWNEDKQFKQTYKENRYRRRRGDDEKI